MPETTEMKLGLARKNICIPKLAGDELWPCCDNHKRMWAEGRLTINRKRSKGFETRDRLDRVAERIRHEELDTNLMALRYAHMTRRREMRGRVR